jgi:transposase
MRQRHPADQSLRRLKRFATSSGCTDIRRRMPSCSAWTRNRRFRRWIARHRCCRCDPAQVERRVLDYRRHGTSTLFAALNVKTSALITQFHQRHRATEFRQFLDAVDAAVPRHLDVHLIMDNYGTHKTPLIRNWFAKRPRFYVHFTPTYGSWLNLVERWFAELTNKQLRRGVHRSVAQLKAAIRAFIAAHEANPKPFVWTKSADEILASIVRFAQRSLDLQAAPLIARTTRSGD